MRHYTYVLCLPVPHNQTSKGLTYSCGAKLSDIARKRSLYFYRARQSGSCREYVFLNLFLYNEKEYDDDTNCKYNKKS